MSNRWERVGALFDAAIALPSGERAAFVARSSAPPDIQREVLSLLASHADAGGFLEQPVAGGPDASAETALVESEPPPIPEGQVIGPYRIGRVIGSGGMGVVYEGFDTRLHRRVAIKSLSPRFSRASHQRERLKQEARAAAALTHPGIATVYALEEFDDQLFIVSEYLDGETLRADLERGPMPVAKSIETALDIGRALCVAHDRGIVHRDLKPENIIRTAAGVLKILDFGVAQFEEAARDLVSATRLTQPGLVAGTPPYMAPEQLLGRSTDARTDQFAFGVMLYELCAGRHPFGGGSLPSTIARILASDPEPLTRRDDIPLDVWRIIERCLQKDPADRYASTRDLVSSLETIALAPPAAPDAPALPAPRDLPAPPGLPAPPALPAPPLPGSPALKWWRFHQFAAAIAYWSMVWPAWMAHRSFGRVGLFFFFAVLAAVVVAGNLRLHLWFSSRVYPEDLPQQRADVSPWIRVADIAFAALLIIGGIALPAERAGLAAVLISFGIGSAVAALFIEPATARAAFRKTTG